MSNLRIAIGLGAGVLVLALVALNRPADPPHGAQTAGDRSDPVRGDRRWAGQDGDPVERSAGSGEQERAGDAEGEAGDAMEAGATGDEEAASDEAEEEAGEGLEDEPSDDDDSAGTAAVYEVDYGGIQAGIQSQLEPIRECYQAWLDKNPDIGGKIMLAFTIDPDEDAPEEAGVHGVEILDGSTVDHLFLEGCVMNAVGDLRFEAPPDGGSISVNYPIVFSNQDAEDSE